jgi:hypothetical protein
MESARDVDLDQLDQAAALLMASLRKSRDLNVEIRQAFLLREQADATSHSEPDATVFGILSDVINAASRP